MNPRQAHRIPRATALLLVIFLGACQSAYYTTMEKVGIHKRDILVSRVDKARDAQEEAKEQFRSALDRFSEVVGFAGGDLREKYDQLNSEYERSEGKAKEVRDRIEAVESVAKALFDEWETELGQYSNQSMRRSSEARLSETRRQYSKLIAAMKRAEKRIDPVLKVFHDHVLFLKHNLNARAIASLKQEMVTVESNVSRLIREMESSIKEADSFIQSMARE